MKHEKTFAAINKLKDVELELHRLKNALEMANRALDAQRPWVGLTGEMLLKAAQASLAPEQYDHFEAIAKHQPDIYDRFAYAIGVQIDTQ